VMLVWVVLVVESFRRLAAVMEVAAAVVRGRIAAILVSVVEAAAHSVVAAEVAGPGLLPAFLVTGMLELWHDDRDVLVRAVLVVEAFRRLAAVMEVAAPVVR